MIKWKHFPRNWPFVRRIYRSPVNSQHKGQWRGALMFSLIGAWTSSKQTMETPVIWDAIALIMTSLWCVRMSGRPAISYHYVVSTLNRRSFCSLSLSSHCQQDSERPWWRNQMETFSALLAFCAGNSPVPGEFHAQRPVTRSFCLLKRLFRRRSKITSVMLSLICVWTNAWVNNRDAGDLRRYHAHYDVIVMQVDTLVIVLYAAGSYNHPQTECIEFLHARSANPSLTLVQFAYKDWTTENKKSPIWQLCRYWCHRKLSLRQLTVPPMTAMLSNWRFLFVSDQIHPSICLFWQWSSSRQWSRYVYLPPDLISSVVFSVSWSVWVWIV